VNKLGPDTRRHDRELIAYVSDASQVVEKAHFRCQADEWTFEVMRSLDGVCVLHEVFLRRDEGSRRWRALVSQMLPTWTPGDALSDGDSPQDATRAAAMRFERLHPELGRVVVDGLLEELKRAGAWLVIEPPTALA
jgi:hypothetical protein